MRVLLRTMQATLLSFARRCQPKSSTACPHGPSTNRLSTGGGQGSGWPPALLEWVDRAFGRCQQPQQRQFVDAGLKATVKQAQEVRATLCLHGACRFSAKDLCVAICTVITAVAASLAAASRRSARVSSRHACASMSFYWLLTSYSCHLLAVDVCVSEQAGTLWEIDWASHPLPPLTPQEEQSPPQQAAADPLEMLRQFKQKQAAEAAAAGGPEEPVRRMILSSLSSLA